MAKDNYFFTIAPLSKHRFGHFISRWGIRFSISVSKVYPFLFVIINKILFSQIPNYEYRTQSFGNIGFPSRRAFQVWTFHFGIPFFMATSRRSINLEKHLCFSTRHIFCSFRQENRHHDTWIRVNSSNTRPRRDFAAILSLTQLLRHLSRRWTYMCFI